MFFFVNWKKKKNYFVFDSLFELCNIYSLKINVVLLIDLYVFDEGNVVKIFWNLMYRVVFVLYFVMFIYWWLWVCILIKVMKRLSGE